MAATLHCSKDRTVPLTLSSGSNISLRAVSYLAPPEHCLPRQKAPSTHSLHS